MQIKKRAVKSRIKKQSFWCNILASTIFFNLAFFYTTYLGFLIIPSFIFLFKHFWGWRRNVNSHPFVEGFVWGVLIYATHFLWLLVLLITMSQASWFLAFLLYVLVVIYFSLLTGGYFLLTHVCIRNVGSRMFVLLKSLFTTVVYYLFLDFYALFPLGEKAGYPFINPFIALFGYRAFFTLFLALATWFHERPTPWFRPDCRLVHLSLDKKFKTPLDIGQHVYHLLTNIPYKDKVLTVFVASESSFPYPLEKYPDIKELWPCALCDRAHLLIGSHFETKSKNLYQAVFWLCKDGIKRYHLKKHCVPFVEKMPLNFKKFSILKNMFLQDAHEFCEATQASTLKFFTLSSKLRIVPMLCSELFFSFSCSDFWKYRSDETCVVFFFVNDSWFVDYFKKIMENLTTLKALLAGLPVAYIGHRKMVYLPQGKS